MPWVQQNLFELASSTNPIPIYPGSQISVYAPPDGSVRIVYMGSQATFVADAEGGDYPGFWYGGLLVYPDGHVHEMLWLNGFSHTDLTNVAQGDMEDQENLVLLNTQTSLTLGSAFSPFGYYTGDPTYAADPNGPQEPWVRRVAYTGAWGAGIDIFELSMDYQASDWSRADLAWQNNVGQYAMPAQEGYRPFGFQDEEGMPHVVYLGADGHIHQLVWSWDYGWVDDDLFGEAGLLFSRAIHSPTAYITPDDGILRIIYIGQDYHIHELRNDNGWQDADLSQGANAQVGPKIVGTPPFPYVTPDAGEFDWRIVYLGTDGDIHELVSYPGQQWIWNNLSASLQNLDSSYQPGSSGPHAFVLQNGTAKVVYVGVDNHVHEFRLEPEPDRWFHADLTIESANGAPNADGGTTPVGFVGPTGEPCVVYSDGSSLNLLCFKVSFAGLEFEDAPKRRKFGGLEFAAG